MATLLRVTSTCGRGVDEAKVLGQTAEASIDGLPGNSGGPSLDILYNTRSRLIGVVRATDLDSG